MVLQYSGSADLVKFSSQPGAVTLLMVRSTPAGCCSGSSARCGTKFPDESLKGTTFYTLLRVLQLRWLRMPKPQVKIGGAPKR